MEKLEAFVFRAVDEVGATLNAALVVMGDKLGLYRRWPAPGRSTAGRAGRAHRHRRALRPRVAERAGGRRLRRRTTRRAAATRCRPSRRVALTDETARRSCPGFFQIALGTVLDSPRITEAARSGAGVGWHEHNHDVHDGLRAVLPARLQRATSVATWLPALDGVVAKLEAGRAVADVGCGHGASTIMMAEAFPHSTFVGSDYHAGLDRDRARARRGGGRRRPRAVRGRARARRSPGDGLRPGDDVRLPARHGRPGRRRPARARGARRRRHVADRRADRRRPRRGQPQPGRPRLLRVLDAALHAGLAVAGGRARARRPGRRGAHPRRRHRRRLHALPPGRRDAVQPRASRRGRERDDRSADRVGRERADRAPGYPDSEGYVERDGVRVAYEVYGDGAPTMLLLPTWTIVHSRLWKMQVAVPGAALPRRHLRRARERAVRTGRAEPAAYADARVRRRRARGAGRHGDRPGRARRPLAAARQWALLLAGDHPERVAGVVCIGPALPLAPGRPERATATASTSELDTDEGWAKYNRHYWLQRLRGLPSSSSSRRCFNEPHSTKQIEDCVGWALETTPETLVDTTPARTCRRRRPPRELCRARPLPGAGDPRHRGRDPPAASGRRAGRADRRRSWSRSRAPATRPHGPRPGPGQPAAARVRRSRRAAAAAPSGRAAASRRRRALFVSSPIGLGHARRDVAIADELRALHPDLEIDWLAQHPVTAVLEAAGERIHPASARLANESAPHRVRVGRARPALLPGAAADGRDPGAPTSWSSTTSSRGRQYDLVDRRRGLGASTTSCTRTRS